jgi:HEAT repeat protein
MTDILSLLAVGLYHPKAIAELVKIIKSTENEAMRKRVADSLNKILREEDQMIKIAAALKEYLSDESRTNNRHRYRECYKVIWPCAQNMSYQKFRQT